MALKLSTLGAFWRLGHARSFYSADATTFDNKQNREPRDPGFPPTTSHGFVVIDRNKAAPRIILRRGNDVMNNPR